MAFNGVGSFLRLYNWVTDKGNGLKILASRMDDEMDGMATGLSSCIVKDGQTTTTAAIPFAVGINTNTISERTSASGVTIDSVLLKDGAVSATASSTITSTDAGATEGPSLTLHRNSASPAASDLLGALALDGESSTSAQRTFAKILATILDPTNASEDATLLLQTIVAGTLATRVTVGQGVQVGSPTGGDQGAGTLNLAGNLFINGGRAGRVAQVVGTPTGAVATGTTTVPLDDTIPQITEGTEFMTQAITPTNTGSTLLIDVTLIGSLSDVVTLIVALFQDATASALAAAAFKIDAVGGLATVRFQHKMTAGTTSSTTFRVRAGPSSAATLTFNGTAGGRIFGGVMASSITITEILP